MNLSRILCFVGRHDLTTWRKCVPQALYDASGVAIQVIGNANERHCKRNGCEYREAKAVRPTKPRVRRPANAADTIQGANDVPQ